MSKLLIALIVMAFANVSFAGSDRVQGAVDFPNPNGCRVFEMVVSPDCPYDLAQSQCETSLKVVQDLDFQLKIPSLKAKCKRLHTGNILERFLEESLEDSGSWDGYTLQVGANASETKDAETGSVVVSDEQTCERVTSVLKKLGLSASCDGLTVSVSK